MMAQCVISSGKLRSQSPQMGVSLSSAEAQEHLAMSASPQRTLGRQWWPCAACPSRS